MVKFSEYLPHPAEFGIGKNKNRVKAPLEQGFKSVTETPWITVLKAQKVVKEIQQRVPESVTTREELESFKVANISLLYNKPTDRLMYESPHHVRHFVGDLVLATQLGKYANALLREAGEPEMDIFALQLASMTHDGFRTQKDVGATVVNYQLHGIRAAEELAHTLTKLGWEMPSEDTFAKTQEINKYHDVDHRPLEKRSREVEFFNMIDKLELVRLFHTDDLPALPYRLPLAPTAMKILAKKRLSVHEGNTELFMDFRDKFLPVAEAMYQLSMDDIRSQLSQNNGDWKKVDQFEAVMRAGEVLGVIKKPDGQSIDEEQRDSLAISRNSIELKNQKRDRLKEFKDLLANPDLLVTQAQKVIAAAKARGAQFPSGGVYADAVATSKQFAKKSQAADDSTHNIGHLFATAALYGTMAEDANHRNLKKDDGTPLSFHVMDGIQAGGVHDSRRWFNHPETFIPGAIYFHGRRAAAFNTDRLSDSAKTITAYHDDYDRFPFSIPQEVKTPEFQLFRVADRLGLVRFIMKESDNPFKNFILHKLLSKEPQEKALIQLRDDYTVVAASLYYLGNKYTKEMREQYYNSSVTSGQDIHNARRPQSDYQFDGFMRAAQELGMIGEENTQDADVAVISSRHAA